MFNILICNAGSSSLKFKLFQYQSDKPTLLAEGQFSRINDNNPNLTFKKLDGAKTTHDYSSKLSMKELLNILNQELAKLFPNLSIHAVGHRVVHGGELYIKPTVIDQSVIDGLKKIIYLTPIHLPHNIAPMEVCQEIFKGVPQVACFDTAFHSTIPELNRTYAIPSELTEIDKIKRYGFHGLSYEYLSSQLHEINPELAKGKVVMAHLGAGASICAVLNGKSVDTTMGLTPLEGLVMGTRCGSIDPSIVLYLMDKGLSYQEITNILYFKSGLLGVSGISSDFSTISQSTEPKAQEAYSLFVKSVTKNILAMTASLKGINGIVFAGGIGENSAQLRQDVIKELKWLGACINTGKNQDNATVISDEDSKIKILVIPTQEELVIANQTYKLTKA